MTLSLSLASFGQIQFNKLVFDLVVVFLSLSFSFARYFTYIRKLMLQQSHSFDTYSWNLNIQYQCLSHCCITELNKCFPKFKIQSDDILKLLNTTLLEHHHRTFLSAELIVWPDKTKIIIYICKQQSPQRWNVLKYHNGMNLVKVIHAINT